eukprot:Protomagalhaensia_sp_Gyna_25__831@NODE_13_length_8454_cov_77_233868_g9_i0_p1_GENE_NODE_13_length_8454_cov_77_233868_g9_i0NODE_13_length_8454_cov_77_233868_g9_i0_p1_ORF_typecomplete_len551_score74_98Integrin_beta/PF00362_18/3e13Integrin_beta/PF00362_18/2_5e06Mucin15/PF15672_5/0_00058VWA/PF00092_28/0_17DUF4536/PF15055_6/5_4e02DUF4536/PF15055_6/4_7e03DUF4536/PF15055_6/3_6_NODE_13_length_8454_cov_77_233868_g9_i067438395
MKAIVCLVSAALGQRATGECEFDLEILQIQDASGSFYQYIDNMKEATMNLTEALGARYPQFKFGVAGFIDKPIPFRGLGAYGGYQGVSDWCYRLFTPLTTKPSAIEAGLTVLRSSMGSGGDAPENPLEAMIFGALDGEVGWSDPYAGGMSGGDNTVRMLLVVTDDRAHQPTEADDGTARGWNWPRDYPNGPTGRSSGGFGAHSFWISNQFAPGLELPYYEMSDLFAKFDHNTLNMAEQETLLDYIDYFGPFPWPKVQPFPGDNSVADCATTEYPSLDQVAWILQERNVLPVFLVPSSKPSLQTYYTTLASKLGVLSVVAPMDSDTILENIVEAIDTMAEAVCRAPSTTPHPPPTTSSTTTTTTTTTEGGPVAPTRPPTIPPASEPTPTPEETEVPSETEVSKEPTTESTTHISEVTHSSFEAEEGSGITSIVTDVTEEVPEKISTESTGFEIQTTELEGPWGSASTHTSQPIVVIPVVPPSGPSAGVIAGAVAGSVAGAGLIAAGAYAALGANWFRQPVFEDLPDSMTAEGPTNPLERDTPAQMTMDMFN